MRTCTALSPWLSVLWNYSVWPLEGVAITGKKIKKRQYTVFIGDCPPERLWCLICKEETRFLCPWLHTRTHSADQNSQTWKEMWLKGEDVMLMRRVRRPSCKGVFVELKPRLHGCGMETLAQEGETRRWVREQRGVKEASVLVQWVGLNRPAGMCELQQQHSTVNPHCHPSFPPSLHHPIPPHSDRADESRIGGEIKGRPKERTNKIV